MNGKMYFFSIQGPPSIFKEWDEITLDQARLAILESEKSGSQIELYYRSPQDLERCLKEASWGPPDIGFVFQTGKYQGHGLGWWNAQKEWDLWKANDPRALPHEPGTPRPTDKEVADSTWLKELQEMAGSLAGEGAAEFFEFFKAKLP